MKKVFTLYAVTLGLAIVSLNPLMAQSVAINMDGSSANASAILDVKSTSKGMLVPRMTLAPERKAPLITQHHAVTRVKHRAPAFRSQIKRILRQVVFSRHLLRCRPRNVERRDVVDRLRVRVRREKRHPVAEALAQARFQSVVDGIRDASDLAHGCIDAVVRSRQRAARVQPALVDVVDCRLTRMVNSRISFDQSRQMCAARSHVAGLQ